MSLHCPSFASVLRSASSINHIIHYLTPTDSIRLVKLSKSALGLVCIARPRVDLTRLFDPVNAFICFKPRELRALNCIFSVVGACITASSKTLVRSTCDTRRKRKFFKVDSLIPCRDLRSLVLQDIVIDLEKLVQLTDLTILFNDRDHHRGLMQPKRRLGDYAHMFGRGIGHLKQLERLTVVIDDQKNYCPVDGRRFAAEISKCICLIELKLEFTSMQLDDHDGATLGDALQMLTRLRKLWINFSRNMCIGERTCQSLAKSLSRMKHLEHLDIDLSENKDLLGPWNNRQWIGVTDDCIDCIAESLQNLPSLVHWSLLLDETITSGNSTSHVGKCLGYLKELRHLEYSVPIESTIGLAQMSTFADGLICLSKLQSLDLKFFACHLGDEVLAKFSRSLSHLHALTSLTLDLWNSGIQHEGISALSQSIAHLHQLSTVVLDLSRNSMGAEGGSAFASQVRWPENVKSIEIELGQCDIGWIAVQSLAHSFFKLSSFHNLALNLDDNEIGQSEWEPLSRIRKDLLRHAKCVKISCVNHAYHTNNDDDDEWDENAYEQFGFDFFESSCG